jgi:hypothetical protein
MRPPARGTERQALLVVRLIGMSTVSGEYLHFGVDASYQLFGISS